MSRKIKQASRILLHLSAAGLIMLSATVPAAAAAQTGAVAKAAVQPISILLDQQKVQLQTPPILMQGNLMLPAKALFGKTGVALSVKNGTITAVKEAVTLSGKLNSATVVKGKQIYTLKAAPAAVNGTLYVSSEFVALVLDKEVVYDGSKRQVTIGYSQQQMTEFQRTLVNAARLGDVNKVKAMISRGVDVNLKGYGGGTALDSALSFHQFGTARVLMEHGASVFRPVSATNVTHSGDSVIMEMLLSRGLDPNWKLNGVSLLKLASGQIWGQQADGSDKVTEPNINIVNSLLQHGADPVYDDSLSAAVQAHSYEIIQALLAHGADPYRADNFGVAPYERARLNGITSWMTLGPSRTLPAVSFLKSDGSQALEGIVNIAPQQGFTGAQFHWMGGEVYLDVPDGEYKLSQVQLAGFTCLLTDGYSVIIKQGKAEPSIFRLPAANVSGTLKGAAKEQQSGALALENMDGRLVTFIDVLNGQFKLTVPPGTYSISEYRTGSSKLARSRPFLLTIPADGTSQQITLSIP